MIRLFRLLLLFGALLGLFSQQAAYAASAGVASAPSAVSQMSDDCMEMMQKQQPQPAQKPCKGMTLDCIAAMGVVPIILGDVGESDASPPLVFAQSFWPATPILIGTILPPEQHPPTILS